MKTHNCDAHILMVEDDPDFARLIQFYFDKIEGHPFCLEWVRSLEELTQRLHHAASPCEDDCLQGELQGAFQDEPVESLPPVDLVLTDLGLPGSYGAETFLRVHEIVEKAELDVPIVVLTGNPDRNALRDVMRAGAEHFLEKQDLADALSSVRLERVVHTVLERYDLRAALKREQDYSRQLEAQVKDLRAMVTCATAAP